MSPRQHACTPATFSGRRRKAIQFSDAFTTVIEFADQPGDVADACVTLAVHAGIAAADVLCCTHLGYHASGESHGEAIRLLEQVDKPLSAHLSTLLKLKQRAGYSHDAVTQDDLTRAKRAMNALVDAARQQR